MTGDDYISDTRPGAGLRPSGFIPVRSWERHPPPENQNKSINKIS